MPQSQQLDPAHQKALVKLKSLEQSSIKLFCKVVSLLVLACVTLTKNFCFRRIQRCYLTALNTSPKWTPYVPLTLPFKFTQIGQRLQALSALFLKKSREIIKNSYNCLKCSNHERIKLTKIDLNRTETGEGAQTFKMVHSCQERIRKARENLELLKLKKNLIHRSERTYEVSKYS